MTETEITLPEEVEILPLDALVPATRNARTHTPEQVTRVADSIRAFGWTNPVLIDKDNTIIAGHCRVLAAREIGLERVPCLRWIRNKHRGHLRQRLGVRTHSKKTVFGSDGLFVPAVRKEVPG